MRFQKLCAEDPVVLAVPMEKNQRIAVSPDLIAERNPVYRQLYQDSEPSF
jgi:hypothetical protein